MLTVLDRLERKGLVRRVRDGRAHRYAAVAGRDAYTAALMHEALGSAPDPDAVLVRFAETVTPEEATILRQALDRRGHDAEGRDPVGRMAGENDGVGMRF